MMSETERIIAAAVTEATPEFASIRDEKFARDVRMAVHVALDRFTDLVGTDEAALPPRVREVFVALGAAEAREDRGPDALLAALRNASRAMLRTAADGLSRMEARDPEVLIDLADAVTTYVDELAAAGTEGFARQLREQAGEGERRRTRFAELLLRGGVRTSIARDAATDVGWDGLDTVVPVLLPLDQARDARFRYGSDGVVVERERDAVLLIRDGPRTAREELTETLSGRGAVVGPALGWNRVPESVRLAEQTATLAKAGDDPAFADDSLAALCLLGHGNALAVLSERRLAPFGRLKESQRRTLLVTLHSWLRHWGSRAAVAAELFVHAQTVSYRLGRLREILGDELDSPTARFELLLVLAAGSAAPAPAPR